MKIARVFATRTNQSPVDADAYYGPPGLFTPQYDEVWVSVTFTWDIARGLWLKKQWEVNAPAVKIGGPAFNDCGGEFVRGRFLRPGFTITSRGCPNKCPFCFVPKREGSLRELPIVRGNVVQDNNILACSKGHFKQVIQMLSTEKAVDFAGGFEARRLESYHVELLRQISIRQLWLAYDNKAAEKPLVRAVQMLGKYFRRNQLRCYVLVGYGNDTKDRAEGRLRRAWEIGTLPFAMPYRGEDGRVSQEWKRFGRLWQRPAIIKSRMGA